MFVMPETKTIIEPFRIKMVEPLPMLTPKQRDEALTKASFNLFSLDAEDVTFDFLTDSGTSAMSAAQWSGIMIGDESYAGSKSFKKFESTIHELTGMEYVIPTHQGRSAEDLLMRAMIKKGDVVIGNTHFDTTRANIESAGALALDMPCEESKDSQDLSPFKGNLNLDDLSKYLKDNSEKVSMVITTITNNSAGGQPVSMENIAQTKEILAPYNIPLFLDSARFAENSYFIKSKEKGYENASLNEIVSKVFALADGVLMSAKKDAFANIGGFLALRESDLAQKIRTLMVITEGFPTYGGLAGRDLEALSIGIKEIIDENYLSYRLRSVSYLGEGIENAGLKTLKPYGGHAVYIDAKKTLPHIKVSEFPGQALSIALYKYIGVRSVEVGSVMLGHRDKNTGDEIPAPHELVRLAIPRRVYTQSHIDYIVEMMNHLPPLLESLKGVEFKYQAPILRHFTAKYTLLD